MDFAQNLKKATMNERTSRRKFLSDTSKASLATGLGITLAGSLLESCSVFRKSMPESNVLHTGFTQQPLPYAYKALEPMIDAMTMEIHYSRHAAAYAKALNEEAQALQIDTTKPLEDVLTRISKTSVKMRNNAGGHYNHELFWQSMTPNGKGTPSGKLLSAIEATFGTFSDFKTKFSDEAKTRFGSGWAWLVIDADKKLKLGSTPNQDNPLMDVSLFRGTPLLGLDVWEHAYYLKYQNKRPDYIDNWWKTVNWDYVQKRYEALV